MGRGMKDEDKGREVEIRKKKSASAFELENPWLLFASCCIKWDVGVKNK